MARQSSESSRSASSRPTKKAEQVEEELDAVEDVDAEVDDDADLEDDANLDEEDGGSERSAQADALWSDVKIEPIELALPKGVGYTLRAYRLSTELTPTQVEEEEDDFAILHRRPQDEEDDRVVILENAELFEDEEPEPVAASKKKPAKKRADDAADEDSDKTDEAAELDESKKSDTSEKAEESDKESAEEADEEADEAEEEDEEEEEAEPEEVPAFLSHHGKLLLFRSVEGLVEFVKSDAEHDLTQLDTWESLKTRITASSVVPTDENHYELDLVVENLRGGQDAWDTDLLLAAGEVARDLAYALRLEPVRTALAAGSPLDDLDEGLRAAAAGGVGGFFAKRRLKKIGAQQTALGWRTIIGKISAAVDWRD
ncbi:DNA primase [Dactylosporangium sp. NPDC051484]|uniref:DNA primase n=1 Tax=Dactylosporangium sp. NPDC051484 TaxID=3154942 RepID=UPI00344C8FBA